MDIKELQGAVWGVSRVNVVEVHTNQATPAKADTFLFWQTHKIVFLETIKSGNDTYYSYKDKITNTSKDTITNTSTNSPESYEINGVVKQSKVGNKVTLDFNGSGFKTTTSTDSNGKKIETTYKVYSKMQGELCKNGNIKIILDEENGETSKAKIDGQEVVFNDLYSSESNYCLKKVK
jgi:predicted nucleic acid-binding Zn ribbon protein